MTLAKTSAAGPMCLGVRIEHSGQGLAIPAHQRFQQLGQGPWVVRTTGSRARRHSPPPPYESCNRVSVSLGSIVIQCKDMDSYLQQGRGRGGHHARRTGPHRRRYRRLLWRSMPMRHFLQARLPATLPKLALTAGMIAPALATGLMLSARRAQAPPPRFVGACRRAIPVPPIT